MHAVHTRTCFLTPATTARKRFRFGFHRRLRVLFAWLITFPKCGALPQNSHFSAIFLPTQKFILGLGFPLEVSQNQATYSSRPSTSGKARLLCSGWFCGVRLLYPGSFFGTPLFFRTGLKSALRTSNPSNRIEATGFADKKDVPLASRTIVDCVSHA
jgi:hypothetical protein